MINMITFILTIILVICLRTVTKAEVGCSFAFFTIIGLTVTILHPDPLLGIIIGFMIVASDMDYRTKEIYDFLNIFPICVCLICIIIHPVITFQNLIPLIFTWLTVTTRGFGDTLAMTVFSLYGIYEQDPLMILTGFMAGYFLQFVYQIYKARKSGISRKEWAKGYTLPFLPALFIGFLISILL